MKKILLGLCLLSSLTLGIMEKQFDIKVEKEDEVATFYTRPNTKSIASVFKCDNRLTQEFFYQVVDVMTKDIKVNIIRAEDKFVVCKHVSKNDNYLPYIIFMANMKTNSVVAIETSRKYPNDAKKLLGYLKANNILSYENKLDIDMFFIDLF